MTTKVVVIMTEIIVSNKRLVLDKPDLFQLWRESCPSMSSTCGNSLAGEFLSSSSTFSVSCKISNMAVHLQVLSIPFCHFALHHLQMVYFSQTNNRSHTDEGSSLSSSSSPSFVIPRKIVASLHLQVEK